MASVNEKLQINDGLLRTLIYGPGKAKKTWWCGMAAEFGYNVLLFDGDNGWQILSHLTPTAQKRIQIISMQDKLGKAVFAPSLVLLLKRLQCYWSEETKEFKNLQPDASCINIDLRKLGQNDIVVIDSWTAFVNSLIIQYSTEQNIDLSDAEKVDWDGYRWTGHLALWALNVLVSLPCHLIVVAHVDVYEKRSKDQKSIEWQKRQIKSTSGPNAMQIPCKFGDVLYFYPKGSAFKIEAKGDENEDGGSRIIVPSTQNWETLQFIDIIKMGNIPMPPKNNPLIDYSFGSTIAKTTPIVAPVKPVIVPKKSPVATLKISGTKKPLI